MTDLIRTEALTKYYGRRWGLAGLDLDVHAGEVYGFLGPNGAGKTTTIRILLDLIRPTSGRASILGGEPLMNGFQVADSAVLAAVSIVLVGAGGLVFDRRDIAV